MKIKYSENNLTYAPHPIGGGPGVITITEDASITAPMHEAQHFYDDLAKGFPGFRIFEDAMAVWKMEFNAYMAEVTFLRKAKQYETAKKILENAAQEKMRIEKLYQIKL